MTSVFIEIQNKIIIQYRNVLLNYSVYRILDRDGKTIFRQPLEIYFTILLYLHTNAGRGIR